MSRNHPLLLSLLAAIAALPAYAVDGVIEINHARALAGGVTPGDGAGYPVTLSQPGSYRLTGSLSAPAGTDAISITAARVSLDLNGFRIGSTSGAVGIDAAGQDYISVRNGAVESFAGRGILTGSYARIEGINANNNGVNGIEVGSVSIVTGSSATANGANGIVAGGASAVTGCSAVGNVTSGISAGGSSTVTGNTVNGNGVGILTTDGVTISGNTVLFNSDDGIRTTTGCSIRDNISSQNGGDGIEVGGSSSITGNTANMNTRCGLKELGNGLDYSGYAQNVFNSNNGGHGNRQVYVLTGSPFYDEVYATGAGANTVVHADFTNVCSNQVNVPNGTDSCYFSSPANNCP